MTPGCKLIIAAVCEVYGIGRADLMDRCRLKQIAEARAIAIYLSRRLEGLSYPELGFTFGNRDHTTMMSAYRKIDTTVNQITLHRLERVAEIVKQRRAVAKTEPAPALPTGTDGE